MAPGLGCWGYWLEPFPYSPVPYRIDMVSSLLFSAFVDGHFMIGCRSKCPDLKACRGKVTKLTSEWLGTSCFQCVMSTLFLLIYGVKSFSRIGEALTQLICDDSTATKIQLVANALVVTVMQQ